MSKLNSALQQLREERNRAQAQVQKLEQAISVIQGLAGRTNLRGAARKSAGRSLSAAARRRISQAQRARWAQRRKQVGTSSSPGPKAVTSSRKPLSTAARRRIAAAQRARWARFRSQQKAAA
jgi:hypothetical protein